MFARSLPLLVAVMCFSACGAERKREKEYRQAISKEHQFLYVHAADGLVLRKAPGKDSEKLGIIPRDTTPLTVIEPADPKYRYVAERTGSFELSGQWVKVRTAKGQEGYLFDGYLLPFPPVLDWPDSGITDIELAYSYVIETLCARYFVGAGPARRVSPTLS
ncbi:MAG: SH3 domain-containing protein [Saprospiraceae bacterium]|nr:SH3 domain-containing protein [Saprospiraceae bacterium]MDW8485155.1 SH3 domain-containing protein [Saprospiraceae bacterium]